MSDPIFNRLSSSNTSTNLGPLESLIGTWKGSTGWNIVALPNKNIPKTSFILLVQEYYETITFKSLGGATPNRGPNGTQSTYGLEYELSINEKSTNNPLHKENGMWLIATDPSGTFPIARQSSIPHGDVLLAQGNYKTYDGPPVFNEFSVLPVGQPQEFAADYTVPYESPPRGTWPAPFPSSNVNKSLAMDIENQKIIKTTHLSVDSKNEGGVLNIPFVTKHANIEEFSCDFYIETVQNEDQSTFLQLQYSQNSHMHFLKNVSEGPPLVLWPHANVNTLVKQ